MIHDIFVEQEGEPFDSQGKMLRLSMMRAAYIKSTTDLMPAVVYLAIGEFDESTFETTFVAPAAQQFAVEAEVLVKALVALGILAEETLVPDETLLPKEDYAA